MLDSQISKVASRVYKDSLPQDNQNRSHLATRGASIVLAGRSARMVCQFLGLAITARYLTPFDFGIVSMAGVIVGAASMLGDFGLSLSALRSSSLDRSERDSLFWINTAFGLILAIFVAAAGPALSAFYHEPRVTNIVLCLCPVFLFNGAVSQYRVDMMRRAKYAMAASIDVTSSIFGLVVGTLAVVSGAGYWTLVAQNVLVTFVSLIMTVFACGWLPRAHFRADAVRGHLSFGWMSTLTQVCNYGSSNISSVALGRILGPEAVGNFSRAFQLFSLPVDQLTSPITSMILPLLSSLDKDNLPLALCRIQRFLVYNILCVCLFIAVGGAPLIALVLGEKWSGINTIVEVLMIGAIFQLSGYVYYWAFLLTGDVKSLFWCEVPSRLVMAGLVVIGARYGEMGAAVGHSVGLAVCWFVSGTIGMRTLGWRIRPLLLGSAFPVALYLWAFAVGSASRMLAIYYNLSPVISLQICFISTIIGICSGLVFPVYRAHARELFDLALSIRKKTLIPTVAIPDP